MMNLKPSDLPIQFRCMRRTFSGHLSRPSRAESRSPSIRNLEEPLRQFALLDQRPDRQPRPSITCSLASTVWSTGPS